MVYLRLLGTTSVSAPARRGQGKILEGPKRLALLAYLAAARPFGVRRREALLETLWAGADRSRARGTLRSTLRILRRVLGPRVLVCRSNGEVGLNPDVLTCDLWTFESALTRGDRAAALRLFRGDLMHGFEVPGAPEFESWLERERLRLRESATTAAREHARACHAAGDIEAALWAAGIALALDPADERLVSWTMEVRAEQGDRTAALRAYRDLEVVLRREYGVAPSPETVALRDRLARRSHATIGSSDATHPAAWRGEHSLLVESFTGQIDRHLVASGC